MVEMMLYSNVRLCPIGIHMAPIHHIKRLIHLQTCVNWIRLADQSHCRSHTLWLAICHVSGLLSFLKTCVASRSASDNSPIKESTGATSFGSAAVKVDPLIKVRALISSISFVDQRAGNVPTGFLPNDVFIDKQSRWTETRIVPRVGSLITF